jgi:hypothetical protein
MALQHQAAVCNIRRRGSPVQRGHAESRVLKAISF